MLNQLTHVTVWGNDQDEALAFHAETLGMEVRDDTTIPEMGGFRWLTVGPAKQPGLRLILVTPGPPVIDGEPAAQPSAFRRAGGKVVVDWVEKGRPPRTLLAARRDAATGIITQTRRLCPYPEVARDNGRGDTNDARSVRCARR
jgi:catechol 2,3-dioxygenase-like lactoylglutathione lyase family enzyme